MRVRIAVKPKGPLHVGQARTALVNWLFARKARGTVVLRIDALFDEPSVPSAGSDVKALIRDLKWLGLDWDEGPDCHGACAPYRQEDRMLLYQGELERLKTKGRVYLCKKNKSPVWRLKTSGGTRHIRDLIRGNTSWDLSLAGDFALMSVDGRPTACFSEVVDDALMDITHVLCGDAAFNNFPKLISLYEALEFDMPTFGHVPLVLDGRSRPATRAIADLRAAGYLPESIVAYLAASLSTVAAQEAREGEGASLAELKARFALEAVAGPPFVFSEDDLRVFDKACHARSGKHYYYGEDRSQGAADGSHWLPASPKIPSPPAAESTVLPFFRKHLYAPFPLDVDRDTARQVVTEALAILNSEACRSFRDLVFGLEEKTGISDEALLVPLRYALTGQKHAVEFDVYFRILDRDEWIARLVRFREQLDKGGESA